MLLCNWHIVIIEVSSSYKIYKHYICHRGLKRVSGITEQKIVQELKVSKLILIRTVIPQLIIKILINGQ